MKPACVLLALCCLLTTTNAQRFESTLYVPDSLMGILEPGAIVCNSMQNTVYVGGGSRYVIAVDGQTNQKLIRIPIGTWQHVNALCYSPQDNMVWCTSENYLTPDTGSVTAIDATTNSVVAQVNVSNIPVALCYDSLGNKVYCASDGGTPQLDSTVTVIDAATNGIIATVAVGLQPRALCYVPHVDKVYCANSYSGNVMVIDGATNGVVATIATPDTPIALCYNPQENKVYCANHDSAGSVTVIDCASDSVVATVAAGVLPRALCYNSQENRIYCTSNGVTVIDGATDSVITVITQLAHPGALCYDAQDNRVYCAGRGPLVAIDGTTNEVLVIDSAGSDLPVLCWDPQRDKVYCAVRDLGRVHVVDCGTNQVVARVQTGDSAKALCYNQQDNKLYCANYYNGSVTIIDGASSAIISTVRVGAKTQALCYNSRDNEVYCANGDYYYVTVIDGATNLVTDTIAFGTGPDLLCYNPQNDKVYAHISSPGNFNSKVGVIDCATKQLVTFVSVEYMTAFVYNPRTNAVYCASGGYFVPEGKITVISGATDSVIAVIDSTGNNAYLCVDPFDGRLFCSSGIVIDAVNNREYGAVPTISQSVVCFSYQNNRVYYSYGDTLLAAVDCTTDSVIALARVGTLQHALFCDMTNNKVYCSNIPGNDVTVIAGANNEVRKTLAAGASPRVLEWNQAQNRIYVANDGSSSITVLRDYQGPALGDLDVAPDSLGVVADTVRLRGSGPYAVGEFVLVNTSASYNPDPSDGPSQSPMDTFNYSCSLAGPGGTLDSIIIPHLPESLVVGQGIVCTLSVYLPPSMQNGTYSGWVRIAGRDTAGMVVETRFYALMKYEKLGDLDIDPDSLDVAADTIRVQPQSGRTRDMTELSSIRIASQVRTNAAATAVSRGSAPSHVGLGPARSPVQALQHGLSQTAGRSLTGYEIGRFILVNTSASYNPDTTDGPSQSPVDSLRFTGSLTGSGETLDSIRIFNLPESLAQGQAVVCTLAVYVPDNLPNGDYSGPITITGLDTMRYEVAVTAYALVQKHGGTVALGDLDVDPDSLGVKHDTMNLHTQPAGPNYSSNMKAEFMLVNTDSAYNPDKSDGPSRSPLREVKVETRMGTAKDAKSAKVRTQAGTADSVYVLNLPESLAVGQAVECTLALVIPTSESLGSHSGWVVVSAMDTIGYQVQDSFFLKVTGPEPWKNLDSFRVAPIPFKPHQNPAHDAIHFWGLPAGARVIVYDASGQSVWSATASSDGQLKWDAKVASGIYVYLVVSADGKSSKVGKLSVIR